MAKSKIGKQLSKVMNNPVDHYNVSHFGGNKMKQSEKKFKNPEKAKKFYDEIKARPGSHAHLSKVIRKKASKSHREIAGRDYELHSHELEQKSRPASKKSKSSKGLEGELSSLMGKEKKGKK